MRTGPSQVQGPEGMRATAGENGAIARSGLEGMRATAGENGAIASTGF